MAQFLLLGWVSEWLPITQRLSLQELLLFQLLTEREKKAGSSTGCFLNQLRPCGRCVSFLFFFPHSFINNSKIITGKQLWKHCTSLNILSPFHLVHLSYETVSRCYWRKCVCCAFLRSWQASSFLCRSDIIKGTAMKETGQLFLSMSHNTPLSAEGRANPALCSP